ncbi:MAG: hypothetical protein KDD61_17225 [Bdellovibrionales bacterium]|nr:hypothetical protein [Bdellovibrionales bacterium]
MRKLLLPSFFTSLTTVVGFGSLVFADLDIIRRFGLWGAIGAALEWFVLFIIFPAVLQGIPKLSHWSHSRRIPRFFSVAGHMTQLQVPRWTSKALLLVFPLALLSMPSLFISDSPERLLERSHPARQSLDLIEETRGWRSQVSLVFSDHLEESENRARLEKVKLWPLVTKVEDPYSIADYLTNDLSPPMKSYFKGLLGQDLLAHRLGPNGLTARAVLYVKGLDIVDINEMRQRAKKLCPNQECWLAGSLVSYGELGERILATLYKSLGGSLILVSLILFTLAYSLKRKHIFPLILSAMWGPMALLLIFYIFKVPVYYITSMVASILVGLAGDNAIQFLFFSSKSEENYNHGLNQLSSISLVVTLATGLACSVFFFGYFDPMKSLGMMLIIGIFLSVFGDIWILKGLTQKKS